jgi:hypothetical protein
MSREFWFVDREQNQHGPLPRDKFIDLIRDGSMTRETLIWTEGMKEWQAASEAADFASLFVSKVPPPFIPATPIVTKAPLARQDLGSATETRNQETLVPTVRSLSGFRDPTTLTTCLRVVLWITLSIVIILMISGLLELYILGKIAIGDEVAVADAESSDARQTYLNYVTLIAGITTTIAFASWTYRANYNARQLGATGMKFTSRWAAGWYFVPIANLFKPYRSMKEIWQASTKPTSWTNVQSGRLLPCRWMTILVGSFISRIGGSMYRSATDVDVLIAASLTIACGKLFVIVALFLTLKIVTIIYRRQMARTARQ